MPGTVRAGGLRWPPTAPMSWRVEGIVAIQARIAQIEQSFQTLSARTAPATVGTDGSFDATLATALGSGAVAGASTTAPARQLAPGEYGRLDPPADLAAYGNGRVPTGALAPLGDGEHRLWAPAAAAFGQLRAAAAADGVTIGVTDSYRDLAAQVRLAEEKGLYAHGGLAAIPGTSPHGWGLALDLDLDDRAQSWMQENGWRFGFVEDVPREPWHWTYRPG